MSGGLMNGLYTGLSSRRLRDMFVCAQVYLFLSDKVSWG